MQVRLSEYDRETNPLIDHYKALGRLQVIDANKAVDTMADELQSMLKAIE